MWWANLAFWALEWMLANDAVLQSSDAEDSAEEPAMSQRSLYLPFLQHTDK